MPWGVLFLRGYIYIYMPLWVSFLAGFICHLGIPSWRVYICHLGILSWRVYIYATGVSFLAGYLHICHWGYSFRQGIYIYVTGGILSGRVLLYATGGRILF